MHGEQCVRLFQPLRAAATIIGLTRAKAIVDKGEGKGRAGLDNAPATF
ncbi:hypothetical protein BN2476_650039 [Paraburkholderia piptadeniae]|uniref:Uncharacterized protein n=1 Tax=Paraburkholderia piptadeniae TaxID=1701573 RepID=A0A1N7SMZ7_9BURK|nr:hypothetical protein BN2476_650039 [Paraburkholderia piptadeniae]